MDDKLNAWRKRNWVSIGEMAAFFEVSTKTIRTWWKSGETPLQMFRPLKSGQHCIRFTAQSVIKFVETGLINPDDCEE